MSEQNCRVGRQVPALNHPNRWYFEQLEEAMPKLQKDFEHKLPLLFGTGGEIMTEEDLQCVLNPFENEE